MKGSVQGSPIHNKYPKCKFWYILSTAFTTKIWTNSSEPTVCSSLSAGMVNTVWLCCGSVELANLLFKIHSSSQKPYTVKPVLKTTCIKQSPVFKRPLFLIPFKYKVVEIYLYKARTCLKQPVFGFPIGACLTQVCTPQPLYNTVVGVHSINRVI